MNPAAPPPSPIPTTAGSSRVEAPGTGQKAAASLPKRRLSALIGLPALAFVEVDLARETRALLPSRIRLGIVLGGALLLALLPLDFIRLPEHFQEAVVLRVECIPLLAVFYGLTLTRLGISAPYMIAAGVIAIESFAIFRFVPFASGPLSAVYLQQVIGADLLIVGSSLILPVNGRAMLVLATIPLLSHVGTTLDFAFMGNLPALASSAMAAVIAVAGAENNYRMRRGEVEGRLAKDSLLQARADFIATLTHDIKNPLGVIGGYVQMLREEEKSLSPESREYLTRIEAATRRGLMLAVNFLDVTRIGSHRVKLVRNPLDLAVLLRHTLMHQRCLAELKGIRLTEDFDPDLPLVEADDVQLDRVFTNLVDNAIKFTPDNGTVCLRAHRHGPTEVEVVVEDGGEGLQGQAPEAIFERYADLSRSGESTGLGLFIVKTITEAHGGRVTAENRQEARGARFRVWLPIRGAEM